MSLSGDIKISSFLFVVINHMLSITHYICQWTLPRASQTYRLSWWSHPNWGRSIAQNLDTHRVWVV